MPGIELALDELQLDLENPRISRCDNQREAIQKIIEDQDVKLLEHVDFFLESGFANRLKYDSRFLLGK